MNSGLKQRLVGALVLVCGGLILWPLLFSQTGVPHMDKATQIPPMPEFEKFVVEEPTRPDNIVPVKPAEPETAAPVDQAPPATPPSPPPQTSKSAPTLDSQGLPQGWLLQVASLSDANNADQLRLQLQKQGYKAFIRQIKTANGSVQRVYIGPRMSRDAFDKDRVAIDKRYKVKSIVVQYEP